MPKAAATTTTTKKKTTPAKKKTTKTTTKKKTASKEMQLTPEEIALIEREIEKEILKREYSSYCQYVHRGKWILGKHLKLICDEAQALVEDRTDHDILIISTPPQHGKSQCITETLPSWYLGKYPDRRVIEVSYGDDLAQRFGNANKCKIQEFGKDLFGIALDKTSDTNFTIYGHTGKMLSRGILSGITGEPCDLAIIDDVVKNRQEADSKTYQTRVWEEFLNSINSRLSANGKIIIILTRWHENDLAGKLLNSEFRERIKVINIPCEAEENDILGRQIGDALFPEIGKDNDWLKKFKKGYTSKEGKISWNALYQGRPSSLEGNMLKREWWQTYTKLPKLQKLILSVDATFKDSDTTDYVAIEAWGKVNADIYLLFVINKRMDFIDTIKAIKWMKQRYPKANRIFIEDKANGSAIISVLKHEIAGIIPVNPKESKMARVSAISGCIESGNVYLPENGIFNYEDSTITVHDFVNQCASFPNDENDDMVDSMSQAIRKLLYENATIPEQPHTDWEDMTPKERQNKVVKDMTGGMGYDILKWDDNY